MKESVLEKFEKIANEIKNFKDCYKGNELYGSVDGPVGAEKLISFMIEHPYLYEIAIEIQKLKNDLHSQ